MKCFVLGVGMTKFEKPGRRENFDYPDMVKEAVEQALVDSGNVSYAAIQEAYAGYVYGDSTCGQRALYPLGMTGIPIINVNNNCATGSSALLLACRAIKSGFVDCVLAVGFEQMQRGSLGVQFADRINPMDRHVEVMMNKRGITAAPPTCQMFGNAGREHMERYGTRPEHFAMVAAKNHKHSVNNPRSQFRAGHSVEQVLAAPMIHEPLTKLQCCPTSDGAAAALLCSEKFLQHQMRVGNKRALKAVEILALEMTTDTTEALSSNSDMQLVGYGMSQRAAAKAFAKAGLSVADVQVVELHDCFAANELISYEALGLCPEGGAAQFIERGDNTYGGRFVVNPSGGLISKGHPLGATGLAQCAELSWQLRGEAGPRQVPNAKVGLQHNIGLGGACVVGLYRLAAPPKDAVLAVASKL